MNKWIMKFWAFFSVIFFSATVQIFSPVSAQSPTTRDIPEVTFPELTGPYKVGRVSYEWVDQSREEICASIPGLKRDLMVYAWFPASPAQHAKVAPYMDTDLMFDIWIMQVAKQAGLMNKIHSHAFTTTTLDTDKSNYPVLILVPGYYDQSLNYASIIEELVSHGYIVIGTNHPYGSGVVGYPDGRFVTRPSNAKCVPDEASLNTWVRDVQFVLSQTEKLNTTDDTFKGHLDLSRIGIVGHSFGGMTAVKGAALDSRIKAGASLDDNAKANVMDGPFLFIGPGSAPTKGQQTEGKYWLLIDGTDHLNYGDFGLLKPLFLQLPMLGDIEPARGVQIINSYLLAFFDHYLKGSDLNWPTFEEARLNTYK